MCKFASHRAPYDAQEPLPWPLTGRSPSLPPMPMPTCLHAWLDYHLVHRQEPDASSFLLRSACMDASLLDFLDMPELLRNIPQAHMYVPYMPDVMSLWFAYNANYVSMRSSICAM